MGYFTFRGCIGLNFIEVFFMIRTGEHVRPLVKNINLRRYNDEIHGYSICCLAGDLLY